MTAALPMGGQKITGMADPTVSTDGATKNYVDTSVASFFSTGDLKPTLKTVADTGWILGGANATIGNAGSGATYANANALALYTLIWNNVSSPTANAFCPVTGGLGASAAADWAGLKPLATGWYAGHALGMAGGGGSLTTRALGSDTRNETVTLAATNIPPITSSGSMTTNENTLTAPGTGFGITLFSANAGSQVWQAFSNGAAIVVAKLTAAFTATSTGTNSTPVSLIQPTIWINVMIKL